MGLGEGGHGDPAQSGQDSFRAVQAPQGRMLTAQGASDVEMAKSKANGDGETDHEHGSGLSASQGALRSRARMAQLTGRDENLCVSHRKGCMLTSCRPPAHRRHHVVFMVP